MILRAVEVPEPVHLIEFRFEFGRVLERLSEKVLQILLAFRHELLVRTLVRARALCAVQSLHKLSDLRKVAAIRDKHLLEFLDSLLLIPCFFFDIVFQHFLNRFNYFRHVNREFTAHFLDNLLEIRVLNIQEILELSHLHVLRPVRQLQLQVFLRH